jgi:hypothetical protein
MMPTSQRAAPPLRLASAADQRRDEEQDLDDDAPVPASGEAQLKLASLSRRDAELDELCERLAWWVHTRKLFGAPRGPVSLLGQMRTGTRPLKGDGAGHDAACHSLLAALYIAMTQQPPDDFDRRIFEMHYLHRVVNIKSAAAALGIGRQHWYTRLRNFRRRIHQVAAEIEAHNLAEREAFERRR